MKGQMFLIGAIIVIVALLLIKNSINISEVLERKKFLESGLEKIEFGNIRSETLKSAYNAVNYTPNMTNVTNSFIAFTENKLAGRTVELDGVSVTAAYGNLTPSKDVPLNVTVFNFFQANLTQAILNLSTNYNSPITFTNVGSRRSAVSNFTLNLASSRNLSLWIYYAIENSESVTANATFLADTGAKTKLVGYFDLRMIGPRGEIRDRFSDTVNVN